MRVVFVHGSCVRDGAWWWHRTAELLARAGVPSDAAVLPSCGESGRPAGANGPSLPDDVAAVRAVLRADDEPTVVVQHSYGGMVVAEAAAGLPQVRHLVAITSFLPDAGESLSSLTGGGDEPPPYLEFSSDGTFGVVRDLATHTFMQDCSEQDIAPAHARLVRQSASVLGQPVRAAAWRDIPSTYVVCAADNGTPPELQRAQAARAGRVVEIDAGHHPFLSRPQDVANLISEVGAAL